MMTRILWTLQALLALLFLFAGGVKLIRPLAPMLQQMPMLSGGFLRFVAACEVLGALGLLLPGLLGIHQWITPVAATGLAGIMIGATVVTLMTGTIAMAIFPFVTGLLCAFVAYARWTIMPARRATARA